MYNENNDGSFLYQPRLWLGTLSPNHRGSGMAAIPKTEIVTFKTQKQINDMRRQRGIHCLREV